MSHNQATPVHLVGVPFDDTILVTQPFNGTAAAGNDVITSIGGIGNMMPLPALAEFVFHIFHVPSTSPVMHGIEARMKAQHSKLDTVFHAVPGVQPSAFIIEAKGAPSRQSVVYGRFDDVKKLSFPSGSIVYLCYLENTPCLIEKKDGTLFIGDFNNSMVCAAAVEHNAPLLDVLLLSIDENSVFKTQIGFNRLKEGCFIVAHEPQRVVLSRIEDGRLVELARLENQHYISQASNLTGNGDIFGGNILAFLQKRYQPSSKISEALLNDAIRYAQKETADWIKSLMNSMRSLS